MIDVEPLIVSGLNRLVPVPSGARADWEDVLRRAGAQSRRITLTRRRLALAVVAVAAAIVVGAAIARGIDGFSAWLTGHPGKPAPASEQLRFEAANGHSWAAFPTSTKLRELIRADVDGKRYVLYGWRSGNSLCLRLSAVSLDKTTGPACAPASTLVHVNAPILIVEGNGGFWDEHNHPSAAFSFGIAADGISRVEVRATDGTHRASVGGNAYLWVENEPNTGTRVSSISAVAADGRKTTASVRTFGFSDLSITRSRPPRGPTHVQARIKHPTIGWYVRDEPRGMSLAQAKLTAEQRKGIDDLGGTRLVKPDPLSDVVVGLTGWCVLVVGGGQGCNDQAHFFARGPLNVMYFGGSFNHSDQFVSVAGAAADGVRRVVVFLADGERQRAALRDNLFAALVPNQPPFRVVGYDADGRVVGIQTFPGFMFGRTVPSAARRNLRTVLRVTAPHGATASVRVGRPVNRIRCWRIDFSIGDGQSACQWKLNPGALWANVQPAGRDVFVFGRVGESTVRVQLLFENGDAITTRPVADVFLFAIPKSHLRTTRQLAFAIGYNSFGYRVQRQGVLFRANR